MDPLIRKPSDKEVLNPTTLPANGISPKESIKDPGQNHFETNPNFTVLREQEFLNGGNSSSDGSPVRRNTILPPKILPGVPFNANRTQNTPGILHVSNQGAGVPTQILKRPVNRNISGVKLLARPQQVVPRNSPPHHVPVNSRVGGQQRYITQRLMMPPNRFAPNTLDSMHHYTSNIRERTPGVDPARVFYERSLKTEMRRQGPLGWRTHPPPLRSIPSSREISLMTARNMPLHLMRGSDYDSFFPPLEGRKGRDSRNMVHEAEVFAMTNCCEELIENFSKSTRPRLNYTKMFCKDENVPHT